MMRRILAAAILVVAGFLASAPEPARGCAPAMRDGEVVDVADETALVIWDEADQTEHFIRQATFVGSASNFGFLVPTPSRPRVVAVKPDVFADLARITEAKAEERSETSLSLGCSRSAPETKLAINDESLLPNGVVVLEAKQVGNLDMKVLAFRADKTKKFDDTADELLGWLNRQGYAARPELKDWVRYYIENSWIITAFKIAGEPTAESSKGKNGTFAVKASAVRMSFKTDRPFFPYREPVDQRDAQSRSVPRLLRVFVAAKQRMDGKIGETIDWPGQVVWTNAISDAERSGLLGKVHLPPESFNDKWWLTEFEDRSTPRPGTDELYFERSMDRTTVARPPVIVVVHKSPWWFGPLLVVILLAIGGAALMLVRRYMIGPDVELDSLTLPQRPVDADENEPGLSETDADSRPRSW